MKALTGDEIRQAIRGRWLNRSEHAPVRGVSIDSRTASPEDLFIAVRGNNHDGHDYLAEAIEKGCIAAVVNARHDLSDELVSRFPVGVLRVQDTREALLALGGYYRSLLPSTVVAVTGSNGKTTVKNMIDHILSTKFTGIASPSSYNNEIGVPMTLLSAEGGGDYIICEVGTNSSGEVGKLARTIRPDIGVVTSISAAHIEGLGSVEHIAAEKGALLGWLDNEKTGIVYADNPEFNRVLKGCEARLIRFGVSSEADLRLTDYRREGWGQRFQINDHLRVRLAVPGRHNALNAIAAIAVSARFGFSQEEAAAALADYTLPPMRMELVEMGSVTVVNDTYNANPSSLRAAIEVVSEAASGRLVAIIGDMLELGEQSGMFHEEIGTLLASRGFDLVVGIGELGAVVAGKAAERGIKATAFADTEEACRGIADHICANDMMLIKGSRAMKLENLFPALRNAAVNV